MRSVSHRESEYHRLTAIAPWPSACRYWTALGRLDEALVPSIARVAPNKCKGVMFIAIGLCTEPVVAPFKKDMVEPLRLLAEVLRSPFALTDVRSLLRCCYLPAPENDPLPGHLSVSLVKLIRKCARSACF